MQFCPECKFMTYTKLNRQETPHILENYCKNCGWKGIKEDTNTAIYKRHYREDYIAEKVLSNKYTIFDVALPRVAYDCTNKDCATNTQFDPSKTLIIDNIPADFIDTEFDNLFKSYSDISKIYRIKLTKAILVFDQESSKNNFIKSFDTNTITNYKLQIKEYTAPDKEILYIKYDPNNMKYIYLCANCGTSWNKN